MHSLRAHLSAYNAITVHQNHEIKSVRGEAGSCCAYSGLPRYIAIFFIYRDIFYIPRYFLYIAIRDIFLAYRDTNVHGNRRRITEIDEIFLLLEDLAEM